MRTRQSFTVLALSIAIGASVMIFQWLLEKTLTIHGKYPQLIWALPLAWVLFYATTLFKPGRDFETTDQVLREVSNPHRPISPWLAPLVAIRTLWSHLFGASVGREGTALQIAGSLSESAARIAKFAGPERLTLLRCGLAAGLAAAYQTPWAGFIFALELAGSMGASERIHALAASWIAFGLTWLFSAPRLEVPEIDFSWRLLADVRYWLLCLGLVLISPLYRILFIFLNRMAQKLGFSLRWFVGGLAGMLLLLAWPEKGLRNLGLPVIDQAFAEGAEMVFFFKKTFLTALFCASGWFGGDFTPNMASGAAAGSSLGELLGFSFPALGAAMGLFLPVAFSHRILTTGWVMTLEYFGWKVAVAASPCFLGAALLLRLLEKPLQKLHR